MAVEQFADLEGLAEHVDVELGDDIALARPAGDQAVALEAVEGLAHRGADSQLRGDVVFGDARARRNLAGHNHHRLERGVDRGAQRIFGLLGPRLVSRFALSQLSSHL